MARFPLRSFILATLAAAHAAAAQTSASLAAIVTGHLPALRAGTTLGAWRLAHPHDSVQTDYVPEAFTFGAWCAAASSSVMVSGLKVERTIYFYPPAAPPAAAIPIGAPPRQLQNRCLAGALEIVVASSSNARIDTVAQATSHDLDASFGSTPIPDALWYGTLNSRQLRSWRAPGSAVMSGISRDPTDSLGQPIVDSITFVMQLFAPRSLRPLTFDESARIDMLPEERHAPLTEARYQELLKTAAIDASVPQLRVARDTTLKRDTGGLATTAEVDGFLAEVSRWLVRAESLPPARHAAALFVAERAVQGSYRAGWGDSAAVRQRFERIGATFEFDPIEKSWYHSHRFLRRALTIAPGTRAGDLLFVTAAEMGFELAGACSEQGSDTYRAVIKRGTEYLKQYPHTTIAADLHFQIGRAWSAIVALAHGGGHGYASDESATYQREESAARRNAVAAYALARRIAPRGPLPVAAWEEGWRLAAGLAPTKTYFYCIFD